jgi:hypothetical protein
MTISFISALSEPCLFCVALADITLPLWLPLLLPCPGGVLPTPPPWWLWVLLLCSVLLVEHR